MNDVLPNHTFAIFLKFPLTPPVFDSLKNKNFFSITMVLYLLAQNRLRSDTLPEWV